MDRYNEKIEDLNNYTDEELELELKSRKLKKAPPEIEEGINSKYQHLRLVK